MGITVHLGISLSIGELHRNVTAIPWEPIHNQYYILELVMTQNCLMSEILLIF